MWSNGSTELLNDIPNKLMVGYNTPNWAEPLSEALYYYNFHHKERLIGMLPAQEDDEQKIALQNAAEIAQIQYYYDNKYLNRAHPQARVPRDGSRITR